jgi:hypothetical protein
VKEKKLKSKDAVAQTSQSAVSRISKSAGLGELPRAADLEVGDTAGWETGGTQASIELLFSK